MENHCSVEQQRVLAHHLTCILGDKLLQNALEGRSVGGGLPSPEDLKGKILLKGKKIGGLGASVSAVGEDSPVGDVSEEDERLEMEEENHHDDTLRRKAKVPTPHSLVSPLCVCPAQLRFAWRRVRSRGAAGWQQPRLNMGGATAGGRWPNEEMGAERDPPSASGDDAREREREAERWRDACPLAAGLIRLRSQPQGGSIFPPSRWVMRSSTSGSKPAERSSDSKASITRAVPSTHGLPKNSELRVVKVVAEDGSSNVVAPKLWNLLADHRTPAEKSSNERLSKELSDCVVYCKSVRFSSFKHARIHSKFYEISSFTEFKAKKHMKEAGADFVHHNSRQLTRIYPSGFRTDSSNFNPQEMWSVGCQIVALNFQTAGVEMDLNDGLFGQNGRCGYVLKPLFMRSAEKQFDPEHPQMLDRSGPLTLAVQVISGQQLPKVNQKEGSIVDPLVRVELHGVPLDQAKLETHHIENNGFNPIWDETLKFTVHVPELALVRFVVEDYDKTSKNDFVGQFTLPFSCIQQGYRHIHLLSKDGTKIPPSSLFVHIRITQRT
ncbi:hypothetical protein P4O66_022070 [Electrophorus voltai]|uniref:Phosphoinositide phospholipase C n=1 Tax=Electrophorus voltai TaxID=2609070 RepID=A0AAD8ZN75_9TELE|nr:hypothetical protein P4O66_022070 [Electrophorus voltai]